MLNPFKKKPHKKGFEPPVMKLLPAVPDLANKKFLFIAGLHRSGTSILHRQLCEHPDISGFHDTGVYEDEGQHLQDVFKRGRDHGGPGRFAFDPEAHLTEADAEALPPESRERLMRQWGSYWDLGKPVLVEKSPPTLVRARYFQALFPASQFVFIIRHPVSVAAATLKWSESSWVELIAHWSMAHLRMVEDLPHLNNPIVIRYEDYVQDPEGTLTTIQSRLGLAPAGAHEPTSDRNQAYFERWETDNPDRALIRGLFDHSDSIAERFGYAWDQPYVQEWRGL